MEWSALTAAVSLTIVIAYTARRLVCYYTESKGYPLPPGPIPLPLLGSVLSVNTKEPWLTYMDWRAKYGDVIYVRLLDSDVVVLNTVADGTELLDKRSQITSDRPFIATVEPYGHDCTFGFARFGDSWKLCRRIFHQTFHGEAAASFRPMQLDRARQMIANIIADSDEYPFYYSTFAAAVALSAAYDYEPWSRDDPNVSLIDSFRHASMLAFSPERELLLKAFPFLLHVPDWFPGSWIKREARDSRALGSKVVENLYQQAQERMGSTSEMNNTMVSDHVTRMQNFSTPYRTRYEMALKHASFSAFIGSTETTGLTLMTFTLAMVKHPHVWQRAQTEIDAVVGTERLPNFDDRQSLPYVSAIIYETLRWKPVAPLGAPHATTNSDIYKGFHIPKGATIVANIWAMSRDEIQYPNPEAFIPERFLDDGGMLKVDIDPSNFAFGFGRRACPGRYVADASLWSAIVTMLATLNFNPAKDAEGQEITFQPTFTGVLTRGPVAFPCRLFPRGHVNNELLKGLLVE